MSSKMPDNTTSRLIDFKRECFWMDLTKGTNAEYGIKDINDAYEFIKMPAAETFQAAHEA